MPDTPSDHPRDRHAFFQRLIEARLSRRRFVGGLSVCAAGLALGPRPQPTRPRPAVPRMRFRPLGPGVTRTDRCAAGYRADVLIAWGDPVLKGAPPFAPHDQSAADQARQFGCNNDYVAYLPLPAGSDSADHGLLCVNHEFTKAWMMWDGVGVDPVSSRTLVTPDQVAIEMAAHGHSVIEIRRADDGGWSVVPDSRFARRLTATTPIEVRGPAAGHAKLRTAADPTGRLVRGTLANCAGGTTPWGTVLTCEENFDEYFWGDPSQHPDPEGLARYTVGRLPEYGWGRLAEEDDVPEASKAECARFHLQREPNEPNRFGWVVELDPYAPDKPPVKRTGLGRIKHESAHCVTSRGGQVVVYTGDDEEFQFLYRFVSDGTVAPRGTASNDRLLDEGTLSAARFDADGTLQWLPLTYGAGRLTAEHGFHDQGDVLIQARRAAQLAGATPLDRPEEVESNPVTGLVYVTLSSNLLRAADDVDAANPRGPNVTGHVLELIPPGSPDARDHGAATFHWNVYLLGGVDVDDPEQVPHVDAAVLAAHLRCPDNLAFDPDGRLWIATDGAPWTYPPETSYALRVPDGLWGIDVGPDGRRRAMLFYATPIGAEMCGPCFTPDGETLFVAVQHPGVGATYADPVTRWPAGRNGEGLSAPPPPPRSAVVAIRKHRREGEDPGDPRIGF